MEDKYLKNELNRRTEEVQDLVERMPTRFGVWVTCVVLFIFSLLLFFGWIIRYPDVITGQVNITDSNKSSLKLVSNGFGKLKLCGSKSLMELQEDHVIAYLQNSADLASVTKLTSILMSFDPTIDNPLDMVVKLPNSLSFGDLNQKYAVFVGSINELNNYNVDKLFTKQSESFEELLKEQKKTVSANEDRVEFSLNNLGSIGRFYKRDSMLLSKNVISKFELDKTELNYIASKDAYQGTKTSLMTSRQQVLQTEGKIKELSIQQLEKGNVLKISMIAAYNDLLDEIKNWEIKYVFKAPFAGRLQFLKFWTEDQFVQPGEELFTILPKMRKASGQVTIPSYGAGKIKIGQEVIVKLENFPYNEYGSIKGSVSSVSLSPNSSRTEKGIIENYMVAIDFPNGLKTNYGFLIDVKLDAKGTAEIVTNDRRLLERLFDNLKYAGRK